MDINNELIPIFTQVATNRKPKYNQDKTVLLRERFERRKVRGGKTKMAVTNGRIQRNRQSSAKA
jgi:hypothetical protein